MIKKYQETQFFCSRGFLGYFKNSCSLQRTASTSSSGWARRRRRSSWATCSASRARSRSTRRWRSCPRGTTRPAKPSGTSSRTRGKSDAARWGWAAYTRVIVSGLQRLLRFRCFWKNTLKLARALCLRAGEGSCCYIRGHKLFFRNSPTVHDDVSVCLLGLVFAHHTRGVVSYLDRYRCTVDMETEQDI